MSDPLAPIRALIEQWITQARIDQNDRSREEIHTGYVAALIDCASELSAVLATVQGEIDRLKTGKFTAEEIHNFCHNLHGTVSLEEFAAGCAAEQKKLYGRAVPVETPPQQTDIRVYVPRAEVEERAMKVACLDCQGTGIYKTEHCNACKGTGKVTKSDKPKKCTCGQTAWELCPAHPNDTWFRDY